MFNELPVINNLSGQSMVEISPQKTIENNPVNIAGLVVICSIALSISLTLIFTLERSNRMLYVATLQASKTTLRAPHSGLVEKTPFREGSEISPGSMIVKISDHQLNEKIGAVQEKVEQLIAEIEQSNAQVEMEIAWRMKIVNQDLYVAQIDSSKKMSELYLSEMQKMAWGDIIKSRSQVASSEYSPVVLKSIMNDSESPSDEHINAVLQQVTAENNIEVYKTQVALSRKRIKQLEDVKSAFPEQLRISKGVYLTEKKLSREKKTLNELKQLQDRLNLDSKAHGRLGAMRSHVGDYVEKGEAIAELWDYEKCYLETYIPSADAPKFKVGQKVKLRFPGCKTAFGRVAHIPTQTVAARDLHLKTGVAETDSIVPIRVEPIDSVWPTLPIGTRVQVGLVKE